MNLLVHVLIDISTCVCIRMETISTYQRINTSLTLKNRLNIRCYWIHVLGFHQNLILNYTNVEKHELYKIHRHNRYSFHIISKVKSIEEFVFHIFDRWNLNFEFKKLTVVKIKKFLLNQFEFPWIKKSHFERN